MAVHRGWPVEQVCNRKKTTWYENHVIRVKQSGQSESRVEPGIRSRSEALGRLRRYGLQVGASAGTHWRQEEDTEQEEGPSLSMSPSISQTYNKQGAPFKNKMREIYFYKEVCFVSFIEVRSLFFIMFLVGSMRSIQRNKRIVSNYIYIYIYIIRHNSLVPLYIYIYINIEKSSGVVWSWLMSFYCFNNL